VRRAEPGGLTVPSDSDPSKWKCPPHTKAKHDMLRRYLGGWYPVMSKYNDRVLFLDGFAGRGRYVDGSEGSPLIALRALVEHAYFSRMRDREFIFYFVEADRDNAKSLQVEVEAFQSAHSPWPRNVKPIVINEKFDKTATGIIDSLREQRKKLAPTFAFVDPFGYSGLPMDLLADLLNYPRSELFVNFMVDHVKRFIEREGQGNAIRSLFGLDVSDVLSGQSPEAVRAEHLRAVYERQLHERIKYDHVQSFAMVNKTGNIGYYLLHGTRHEDGVRLMKDAMWKVDPDGAYTFSDNLAGHQVLFTLDADLEPLKDELLAHFAGQRSVTPASVLSHTLLCTPYRETHGRSALKELEAGGAITVNRPPGRRQFAESVTVDFP
jgi:three-Cys-motif partner protein